jgi:hypothetical protein
MSLHTAGTQARNKEFEKVTQELNTPHVILCGDFNALLDPDTEWSGTSERQDKPFINFVNQNGLQDPWTTLNPNLLGATCRRQTKSGPTWSRIDRFLCNPILMPWFKRLNTLDTKLSDHSALQTCIDSAGGNAWSPISIDWRAYNDKEAIEEISEQLRAQLQTPENSPIEADWPLVKTKLIELLMQKSRDFIKSDTIERRKLEKERNILTSIATKPILWSAEHKQRITNLEEKLAQQLSDDIQSYQEKWERRFIKSYEQMDKWFFGLGKEKEKNTLPTNNRRRRIATFSSKYKQKENTGLLCCDLE